MLTQIHNVLWAVRLWAMHPYGFVLIWITMTVAAAICAAWAVGPASTPKINRATEGSIKLTLARQVGTRKAVAAVTLVAIFLMFYIAMTLLWEDFTYYDNYNYTFKTLMGHNFTPQIWLSEGRFVPLANQEFNVIRHFTHTITGYYVIPIAQILIFSGILLVVDDELSVAARAALVILVLLTPSVWISLNGLLCPERNVLFFLACLLLSVKRFEQTQSIAWAMAATICGQVMIYYKEPAFLLLLGFAAGRLMLRCRNAYHAGWDYDWLWDKESRLDWCLACLAILFLLYYVAIFGFQHTRYADMRWHPPTEILLTLLRADLLTWLFVAVVLGRIYVILRRRVAPAPLWDGLALGGVGYFLAYLYLGMFTYYYLAPVDFIAVLYVGRLAILSWNKMQSWGKAPALVLVLTLAVLFQDVSLLAVAIFERKNIIHGKSEIARVIEAQYRSRAGSAVRLFFPFTDPFNIMELAAYLHYRGVPVEGAADKAPGLNSVVLGGREIAKDGRCAEEISIRCRATSGPEPGDLVIVLPDDAASFAETSVYRERGELLFSYEPRPPIPQWLSSLMPPIIFPTETHPDRWLRGSVTIWK